MKKAIRNCPKCRGRKEKAYTCTHIVAPLDALPSCTECHRRKKKCNHQEPCSNCARRYPPVDCIYIQRGSKSGSSTSSKVEPSLANPLQTHTSESKLIRIYTTSPLVMVEDCKVSRSQLVALNEDFLSIDSMYDMNYNVHNTQTLYHCLYQLTNNSETLDVALQALCLIQLSIRNRDVRLKMESMLMNGKALKMLHKALRDPSAAYATETIAASLCLKTFEELACNSEDASGVNQLTKGSRILIRQRGPASFARPIDHVLFARWFREYDVCHALAQEVSTFLAAPEWCTMPWNNIKKDDSDRLIDIVAVYGSVRERVKYLENARSSPNDLNTAESLLSSCLELKKQLFNWLEDFEKILPGRMLSVVSWGDDTASRELFSFRFQFINLKIAMMYLKYWATFILVNASMIHIERYFKRAESSLETAGIKYKPAAKLRPGFDVQKMTEYAMNVCRSLDYALEHTMKSSGPIYLTYPILVVHLFFQQRADQQPLYQWCGKKLREIQSSGYEFISQYGAHHIRGKDVQGDALRKDNLVVLSK